ncbi:SRPBCC family protein [uncultured Mycobacterium sp.]|uniref:SRPBCC family protein n=1 Tax=uncultured Mycobacterium sp. TaxID=171292 RepID=UPI0035CA1326
MIYVSHSVLVNEGERDEPKLSRDAVWDGLVLKANNALPYVPSMTYCEVTNRLTETCFDREIEFRGQRFSERITLDAPHRVVFTRMAGPVLGTIANEIENDNGNLRLRFSFALSLIGVAPGTAAERAYADSMKDDYLKAVEATLAAMRRMASGDQAGSAATTKASTTQARADSAIQQ